jgi:hypothetical protein
MKLRQKIRLISIGALLAYSLFRAVLVNATLVSYGVNPWLFLIIDIASGVSYVFGVENLVLALIAKGNYGWRRTVGWGAVAAISFAAPYTYLFLSGQGLPSSLLLGLGFIVLLLLASVVLSIVRKVRRRVVR